MSLIETISSNGDDMSSRQCCALDGTLAFSLEGCRLTSAGWKPDGFCSLASCINNCHVSGVLGKVSRIRIIRDECFLDCRAC